MRFLVVFLMAVVLPLSQAQEGTRIIYVGSFTEPTIYQFTWQSDSKFILTKTFNVGLTPTWVESTLPLGGYFYTTNEENGAVASFQINPSNGDLDFVSRRPASGNGTTFLTVAKSGKFVLAANYDSGSVVVFPVLNGVLQPVASFQQHTGHGKDPDRQEGPHAHQIVLDDENQFAFSADLGVDKVYQYNFDRNTGQLTPNTVPYVEAEPGDGPRHLAFHPSFRWAYLACEISSTIITFSYSPSTGRLTSIQRLPTLPVPQAGNAPAEVLVLPNGHFVYVSNRGNDSISAFVVNQSTGMLTAVGVHPGGGAEPRGMILDAKRQVLYLMNQGSGTVTTHSVNYDTGLLTYLGVAASNLVAPVTATIVQLP